MRVRIMTTPAARRARPSLLGGRIIARTPKRELPYDVTDLTGRTRGGGYRWDCHWCASGTGHAVSQAAAESAADIHIGAAHGLQAARS